ncbi:nucleic acid binding, OB-fold, tRNA/helicase-type [Chthoniobacter flavus Ellin428]|uniref:Nucleic acid binding, OB-fold, tRNA/helicase-type n=1 Tax=Chthoniobacter flavus Ellin428 TaxID=497964 RepID=B4CUN9_9BACT|nr:hypothetical protein [Chthoniobacter flavus]EDY22277.1 nucleic acid binding, OB-fold, tRNA/helicase-type [Chthoniobacter flavus Ellin428]TCO94704.1 hypothetical protein EV701_102173 [Chthoniobacter flavus]
MKLSLVSLALSLLALASVHAADLTPAEAKNHVGETATVKGTVDQISKGPKAVFLNFGGKYPNHVFSAVSFTLPFAMLSKFDGKSVAVTGLIKDVEGKPEIVVTTLTQITVP